MYMPTSRACSIYMYSCVSVVHLHVNNACNLIHHICYLKVMLSSDLKGNVN